MQPWLLGVSTLERWAPRTRGTFRQQVQLLLGGVASGRRPGLHVRTVSDGGVDTKRRVGVSVSERLSCARGSGQRNRVMQSVDDSRGGTCPGSRWQGGQGAAGSVCECIVL